MIVALIDNGSLEPEAHRQLRTLARRLGEEAGTTVHAVSWKHSDRIPQAELDGTPAWTLAPFVRSLHALGQREFVLIPFFISPQGAIGSALRRDLVALQEELGPFEFTFTAGLADRGVLTEIVADRIRRALAEAELGRLSPVIVVDHGGPSPASASLRDRIAGELRRVLHGAIGPLAAASMEGGEHAHARPLLSEVLARRGFNQGDVLIAPLFLLPGRHAGPAGDLARLAEAAVRSAGAPGLRCHFTGLIGNHPLAATALAAALRETVSPVHLSTLP